jgi:hypothetical protein
MTAMAKKHDCDNGPDYRPKKDYPVQPGPVKYVLAIHQVFFDVTHLFSLSRRFCIILPDPLRTPGKHNHDHNNMIPNRFCDHIPAA